MLFTGEYEHTIDAKQRLAIPAEVRARLSDTAFYVVPGPNGALWLWPETTFEAMAGAMEQSLVPAEELMEFEELFFSQSARLELDKNGRVRLPERLLKDAGLEQRVMLLGIRDHFELRSPEDWAARRQEKLAKQTDIMIGARRALAARRQGLRPEGNAASGE